MLCKTKWTHSTPRPRFKLIYGERLVEAKLVPQAVDFIYYIDKEKDEHFGEPQN
jgi:hypothetical protein